MKTLSLTHICVALLIAAPAFPATRHVPMVYDNIQAAVDASENGDTVVIAPGTYSGPGNCNINLRAKAITLRSQDPAKPRIVNATVIDCRNAARAFVFRTGEGPDTVIAGITIVNGKGSLGGAVYCQAGAAPEIRDCVIENCSASIGGAIACGGAAAPVFNNCIIRNNSANMGGAVYANAGNVKILNCLITANTARLGGALYCTLSSSNVCNSTLAANSSGICSSNQSDVTIKDSILWNDELGPELLVSNSGSFSMMVVSYSNVRGGKEAVIVQDGCMLSWGFANAHMDPSFVAGPLGEYYLDNDSPSVDHGSAKSAAFGLDRYTTRTDGAPDAGTVDLGFHRLCPKTTIDASLEFQPKTLNLAAAGRWVTCKIELPSDYSVSDIVPATVTLQDEIDAEQVWFEPFGIAKAKFSRASLAGLLQVGNPVEVTVTGLLTDGTVFKGSDQIRVIDNGRKGK